MDPKKLEAVCYLLEFFATGAGGCEISQGEVRGLGALLHAARAVGVEGSDDIYRPDEGIYLFSFGAYGGTHVIACGQCLEDALEAAVELLPRGFFCEPDYVESAKALGLVWEPEEVCSDSRETERILALAETDLTYTASGWLPSWEWCVSETTVAGLCGFISDRFDRRGV